MGQIGDILRVRHKMPMMWLECAERIWSFSTYGASCNDGNQDLKAGNANRGGVASVLNADYACH